MECIGTDTLHSLFYDYPSKNAAARFPLLERVAALYDLGWTLLLTLLPAPDRCFSAPLQPRRRGAGWIPPCRPFAAGCFPSGRCGIWNVPSLPPTGRTPGRSRFLNLPSPWGESDLPWPLQCPARRGRDSPQKTAGRTGRHCHPPPERSWDTPPALPA